MKDEALKLALEALKQTLQTLDDENSKPGGAIADTIWHTKHETLFDYLGSKITAIKEALAQPALPKQEPVNRYCRAGMCVESDKLHEAGCTAHCSPPLPVQSAQAQQGMLPDCWVVIKDGQIIGTHDEPGTLNGVAAIRYVPALPMQEPVHSVQSNGRRSPLLTHMMNKRTASAQPAQESYDQTALELCNVCGWKTLIPDDGCLNCERAQPAQEPVAENEAPPPSEYEQGFAAGVGFILHTFEQQMSLPPYDQHTDILERLLDYLKH